MKILSISLIHKEILLYIEKVSIFSLKFILINFPYTHQAHQAVRENMDQWVERYLISDNSPRVRAGEIFQWMCYSDLSFCFVVQW